MPGQMRGSKRGRGASRGGGGRGGGGRGGRGGRGSGGRGTGGRGTSRGRSSSRGGGGVVRQNDDSFPTHGGHAKRDSRGGAGRGSNPDRRWRKESGSVHSSSGQEMKEPSIQMPENQQREAVNVDEEASKSTAERQLVVKKGKKGSSKNKSDCKASLQTAESPGEGTKANLPSAGKMPELRKPELKPVVKNPKMKISKEPPPSDPVEKTLPSKEVVQKSELWLPVAPFAKLVNDSKLNISDQTSLPMNVSNSTGLKVLSITSSFPGYVFTTNDRAKLVRSIPGVVIINTANKGDKLVLGVEMDDDQLSSLLPQLEDQNNWNFSYVDTTDRDTFAYFAGWKLIPRVDKSGMFQLIVNLRTQGSRSRVAEMKRRNQLLDLVKDFNISKIVHGEGETILLVSHVLECVAYSDLIRKKFTLEKRHTWLPKLAAVSEPLVHQPGQERHFWVKVKDPELNNLTTAHKQYTVYHQLANAGKVLQLEHQLFGVEDNYLVVYSDMGDAKMPVLGQQFCLLELLPDALPDIYTPSYGVDAWGFYSVSGKFPENVSDEARNKFAEDMKKVGAVGFRSGEAEYAFSLHFVNSRCLEQISRCAQFSSFRLTILSSLVRKPRFEKKLMKMVPSILKYKELKLGDKKEVKPAKQEYEGIAANHENKMEEIEVFKMESIEPNSKPVKEEKTLVKDVKLSKKAKIKVLKEKGKPTKVMEELVANKGYVSEISNKKVAMMEKVKEALKNVEPIEKKVAPASVDESLSKLSESELLRICWKREGSLHKHLDSLGKFLKSQKEVVVSDVENSKEVVFSFAEEKVVEVLNLMCSDGTNSLEKIEAAPQKIQVQGSKFFKNKFGAVLEKNYTISQLKIDFSKFGVEIEVRSQVFVLWCDSKLGFYKMLTDPGSVGYKLVPCVQNFKFAQIKKKWDLEEKKIVKTKKKSEIEENEVEVPVVDTQEAELEKPCIQLTEREIFGFIWQKTTGKINIRDDQVISRQLTNFIKTVVCEDISTDEDGVVVSFSTQAEKTAALSKFCPALVPDREQLAALARKFTLLPSRGFFGLFSVKRVKPEHFTRFGDCKIRNCGIWFTDKLSMCSVLRDPFISKTYPTLFIDCRNIYILSSQKSLPQVKPDIQEKPAATSSLKTCPFVTSPPCQGVVTRSVTARMSPPNPTPVAEEAMKVVTHEKLATTTPDPAILTAVSAPAPTHATPCPLLNTLLPKPELTVLGQGKFGYNLGKVGHIPSARLVRTGYKQGKLPDRVRDLADDLFLDDEDLFLEDKDCYRSKDVKEAASLISNILEGKMSVAGNTLREIKMKRVEHFLKDKLGVECKLSKEGKEKLQAGGMIIENEKETEEIGQEIEKKEVNSTNTKFGEQQNEEAKGSEDDNEVIGKEVVVDYQKDERKQMLLKREAERREFVKQALIYPEELVHEDKIISAVVDKQSRYDVAVSGLESVEMPVDEFPNHLCDVPKNGSNNVVLCSHSVSSAKSSPSAVSVLTPDLMGFYTLSLPVPQGSDLNIFSTLQEDISWFDTPVSLLCIENISGGAVLEVKFRDQEIAMAVLKGLKHKYPGLEADETGKQADIVEDKETGLFTLCFTDSKRKRYKATMDKFRIYGKLSPVISRGMGAEQVLVAFHMKEEAVLALKENIDSEEFPELHVAPVSRG